MAHRFRKYPSTKIYSATNPEFVNKFRDSLISYADFIFESFEQIVDATVEDILTTQVSNTDVFFDCFREITSNKSMSSIPGVSFSRECSMSGGEGVCYFWITLPNNIHHEFMSEYPKYDDEVDECILRVGGLAGDDNIDVIVPDASMLVDELIYFGARNSKPLTQQDISDILSEFISFMDNSLSDALNMAINTYSDYK